MDERNEIINHIDTAGTSTDNRQEVQNSPGSNWAIIEEEQVCR